MRRSRFAAVGALLLLAACSTDPRLALDRPSVYLEKLLYALRAAGPMAGDKDAAPEGGYADLAKNRLVYEQLAANYASAADQMAPFAESDDDTIRRSATAARTAFLGLRESAETLIAEADRVKKGAPDPQPFPAFAAALKDRNEKLWASISADGLQPILDKIVSNAQSNPPRLNIPFMARESLRKTCRAVLRARNFSRQCRPFLLIAQIHRALTGKDP